MRKDVFDKSDAFKYQTTFREMEALRRSIKVGDTVSISPEDGSDKKIVMEYVGHDYIKGKSDYGYPDTISIFDIWQNPHTISPGKAAPDDAEP